MGHTVSLKTKKPKFYFGYQNKIWGFRTESKRIKTIALRNKNYGVLCNVILDYDVICDM